MKVRQTGVDLAKNLFELYGVDENGNVVLKKLLLIRHYEDDVHGRTSAAGGRMPEAARSDEAIHK